MDWTQEQKDAIYKKDSNILVAAAAGSGKTAVLVERIIQKIIKDQIDIDKLLVVTFTNAAASEMRERVLEAIYKKLDENPDDTGLQRQIVLLGKANICTIHSFCLEVIRNNFFQINMPANFRIADEQEIEMLKQEVLEDVFDSFYENEDENFIKLINTYTNYRGDDPLKELILNIYKFMQSSPYPNEWLEEKVKVFSLENEDEDFAKSLWGKILVKDLKEDVMDSINSFKEIRKRIITYPELEKVNATIESDLNELKCFYDSLENSWDAAYENLNSFDWKKWASDKNGPIAIQEEVKDARDAIKKKLMNKAKKILVYNSQSAYEDIMEMYDILEILKNTIFVYDKEFKKKKREKNIIDFNDIEHFALEILGKREGENIVPTDVAKRYQDKFVEIAIDEYQDSNQVQENILKLVSRGRNIFMVGDVKQSIYKFRQACPDLFIDKYEKYSLDGNEYGLKIQLFKNFRSRDNILKITNTIFENIMSKDLGDIDYNENEYLNLGADYEDREDSVSKSEIDIINMKKEEQENIWKTSDLEDDATEDSVEETLEVYEKSEIEAKFIVKKIKELIDSKKLIKDRKTGYRPIEYRDIVILLRSTKTTAPIFETELINNNIPVFSDNSAEYIDSFEIQTIINLLRIIDNPIDDISLVSVLRSEIGKFTDNEIVEIRLCKRDAAFYESMIECRDNCQNEELRIKVSEFIEQVEKWKKECDYLSLAEFIWKLYIDTGFYTFVGLMPNGLLRQANLKMLFERAKDYEKTSFKGLFDFIRFVEKLKNNNSDMSQAKIIGENENVVRIMSIHKSKGLEFPIVFLASCHKKVNLQDLSDSLLLHQEYGIGPQYINYEKMVEYSTSAKDALRIVMKDEAISEEMRILYVALTRAKEKLIITGVTTNYEKDEKNRLKELSIYKNDNGKIHPILLKKFVTYLDWIKLVYMSNDKLRKEVDLNIYDAQSVVTVEEKEKVSERDIDFSKNVNIENYDEKFSWIYPNQFIMKLPIKSTVSKVKQAVLNSEEQGVNIDELTGNGTDLLDISPDFMEDNIPISGAKRGTITHLYLQNIDFKQEYDFNKLLKLKDELIMKKVLSEEEAKVINMHKINALLQSNLAKKIRNCTKIEKEKAFCIKLPANILYDEANDETILVQGIIDLYGISADNKAILVDYKTDYVEGNDESELVRKYQKQLEIYKKALEEGLNIEVNEVYIYSLYMNKEIKVEI